MTKRGKGTDILAIANFSGLTAIDQAKSATLNEEKHIKAFSEIGFTRCAPDKLGSDKANDNDNLDQQHYLKRGFEMIAPTLNEIAKQRGEELLAAHVRVREAAYRRGDRRPQHRVQAQLPPDVLGIYVFLPAMERK